MYNRTYPLVVIILFLGLGLFFSHSYAETAAAPKVSTETTPTIPTVKKAQRWKPDLTQSHINFAGVHEGEAFTGKFTDFDADIYFDPEHLDQSSILVAIETGSVKIESEILNSSVTGANWLNTRNFPQAIFKSSRIELAYEGKDGMNQYTAYGKFKLCDIEKDFALPFVVKIQKANAFAYGEFVLKRLDYGIGVAVDPSGGMVGHDINVKFDIIASKFDPVQVIIK